MNNRPAAQCGLDLLLLDELAYVQTDPRGAELLFPVLVVVPYNAQPETPAPSEGNREVKFAVVGKTVSGKSF